MVNRLFLLCFSFLILIPLGVRPAHAADIVGCRFEDKNLTYSRYSFSRADTQPGSVVPITITKTGAQWNSGNINPIRLRLGSAGPLGPLYKDFNITEDGNTLIADIPVNDIGKDGKQHWIILRGSTGDGRGEVDLCSSQNSNQGLRITDISNAKQSPDTCNSLRLTPSSISKDTTSVTITFDAGAIKDRYSYVLSFNPNLGGQASNNCNFASNNLVFARNGDFSYGPTVIRSDSTVSTTYNTTCLGQYIHRIETGVVQVRRVDGNEVVCRINFRYNPDTGETSNTSSSSKPATNFELCEQAGSDLKTECCKCVYGGDVCPTPNSNVEQIGIWTAVGCIPTNIVSNDENGGMINFIFRIGLGIAGGFALIFILFGAFTITTSAGNPEKVQNGKEIVTAAIIGLLFIILSSVILRFIGVSILQIPGF